MHAILNKVDIHLNVDRPQGASSPLQRQYLNLESSDTAALDQLGLLRGGCEELTIPVKLNGIHAVVSRCEEKGVSLLALDELISTYVHSQDLSALILGSDLISSVILAACNWQNKTV